MGLFDLFSKTSKPAVKGHAIQLGTGVRMDNRAAQIPVFLSDEHRKRGTFTFGTTGVGKTSLEELLALDDIATGKSCIIFDPKCDQRLLSSVYSTCKQYDCLDAMQLITSIFPQYSASIDPMAFYYDPEELVGHATSGIQSRDEFYGAASRLFVTPIIYGNLIMCKAEGKLPSITLKQIYDGLNREALARLKQGLDGLDPETAEENDALFYSQMLASNLAKPPDYYEKICTTLQANLVPLISGNIGKIVGKANSNRLIQRLEEGKRVIAVVHTGTMISPNSAAILGRVLLSMIKSTIGRHYNSGKEKMDPMLSLHIDEAHAVITPDTLQVLAMAGSANVMTHLYSQSVSQIYAALGDENLGRSALDTTNCKIFMKCTDARTSEYVVPHFGVHDVLSGVFGNDQITTRQVEKNVLKETDLLDLQVGEAYMMSHTGRYALSLRRSADPKTKIIFPDTATTIMTNTPTTGASA